MKRNIFIYSAISVAMLATYSCSDNTTLADLSNSNKETINFAPILDNGEVVSRAHSTTPLTKNFYVGVYNNSSTISLKQRAEVKYSSTTTKYTSNPPLYWDNVSADGADVRLEAGKAGASTVKIWAVNVAGRTCSIANTTGTASKSTAIISDAGVLDWIMPADQKTNGSEKNDLLVADFISAQGATTTAIPLCFHHAMTKITVNVIAGEGFIANEIIKNNTVITLLKQNLNVKVDLTKAKGDNEDTGMNTLVTTSDTDVADVIMNPLATANKIDASNSYAASFDAIVAEGKELKATDQLGTITIGTSPKTNTYKIMLNDKVLEAWNNKVAISSGNALKLKHGIHYVLNITVKKQGIELTAVLKDWTSYTASAKGVISFTGGTNNMISDNSAEAFDKPFTVYSKTTTATSYTKGSSFHWISTDTDKKVGNYDYIKNDTMYWANNNDARFFRAALYANAITVKNVSGETVTYLDTLRDAEIISDKVSSLSAVAYEKSKDLIWGASGNPTSNVAINPTTSAVNMLFKHALSQVTVKLTTSTGDDKIDLADKKYGVDKVEIIKTKTSGGEMSLDNGTITATTTSALELANAGGANDTIATAYNCKPYLVLPQQFVTTTGNEPKIKITMKDGSTFSADLITIHKAATPAGMGQSTAAWYQNENYVYTISLTKSKVDFAASIKEWETKTGSGSATMDWD